MEKQRGGWMEREKESEREREREEKREEKEIDRESERGARTLARNTLKRSDKSISGEKRSGKCDYRLCSNDSIAHKLR